MAEIGQYNTLRVLKEADSRFFLDGEELGEILIPPRYVPDGLEVDDEIDVFIYFDSEDRIVATTEKPYAMVDDFALLKVVSVTRIGAFLDWGLPKDLLVPFGEQSKEMEEGKSYVVKIFYDEKSHRIAASSKLDQFLDFLPPDFKEGEEVDLFICNKTDIGYKAIVNGTHWGMLYENEVFQPIKRGQQLKGYIKKIREDEKIDLCIQKSGFEKVDDLTDRLLQKLKDQNGFLDVTDKSPADVIAKRFGVSKKTFKKAVGALYKKRLIVLEKDGIRLIKK